MLRETDPGSAVPIIPNSGETRAENRVASLPVVLVVDDSHAQRRLLATLLRRWGYAVREAPSGEQALALCAGHRVDIVLSDWMMDGMSGVEFCRRFRGLPRESYGYFILLTSKSEKSEIVSGLEAGADDFLTKPVHPEELHARLRAGMRILSMQTELMERNHEIAQTLGELQRIHDSVERDLIEARKLQQALLRERQRDYGSASVAMMLCASGHVGGDLVGSFRIDGRRAAVWSLDVSGHGVAAAMMTARLAGYLSGSSPEQNIAFLPGPGCQVRSPAELMAALNRLMLEEVQAEQYFTMAYAEIDLDLGTGRLAQAGHPHPAIMRAAGGVELVGAGGLPVGLIPDAQYEEVAFRLDPGDRLFLMSDGMTECPTPTGELGAGGALALLHRLTHLPSTGLLDALTWELAQLSGSDRFPDDISALILDYRGLPATSDSMARSPGLASS